MAGVPSVELCMGCHAQFGGDLGGVQTLTKHWDDKQPVPWDQIYRLPEYVKFRHNRHVAVGVPCQRCHGPVETMDKVSAHERHHLVAVAAALDEAPNGLVHRLPPLESGVARLPDLPLLGSRGCPNSIVANS